MVAETERDPGADDPGTGEAWFKLYGEQKLDTPSDSRDDAVALSHSLAKIRLF